MERLEFIPDIEDEIKFWLNSLLNPNLDKESIVLLNQVLQSKLNQYLNPVYIQALNE